MMTFFFEPGFSFEPGFFFLYGREGSGDFRGGITCGVANKAMVEGQCVARGVSPARIAGIEL
jgi:hypothetical protein